MSFFEGKSVCSVSRHEAKRATELLLDLRPRPESDVANLDHEVERPAPRRVLNSRSFPSRQEAICDEYRRGGDSNFRCRWFQRENAGFYSLFILRLKKRTLLKHSTRYSKKTQPCHISQRTWEMRTALGGGASNPRYQCFSKSPDSSNSSRSANQSAISALCGEKSKIVRRFADFVRAKGT